MSEKYELRYTNKIYIIYKIYDFLINFLINNLINNLIGDDFLIDICMPHKKDMIIYLGFQQIQSIFVEVLS